MKPLVNGLVIVLGMLVCSCREESSPVHNAVSHAIVGTWEYTEGRSVNRFELKSDHTIAWVSTFKETDSRFNGTWKVDEDVVSAKFGSVVDKIGTFQVTIKMTLRIVEIDDDKATILWLEDGQDEGETLTWKRI